MSSKLRVSSGPNGRWPEPASSTGSAPAGLVAAGGGVPRLVPPRDLTANTPPPRDAVEALAALREVTGQLRLRGDSRAIFPDLYGIITERVVEELHAQRSLFWEPAFISRLASRFAARYLETLAWSLRCEPQDCMAWALAYARSRDRQVFPLQHAALGISAHINYDLALGIHQTIVELGAARNTRLIRRFEHDHDRVNVLLEESFPIALRRLVEVYDCQLSTLLARVPAWSTRIAIGTLSRWREEVWNNVLALLNARGETARQALIRRMDRRSGSRNELLASTTLNGVLAWLAELPGTPPALAA